MGYINQDPDLFALFKDLKDRLERLENATRFTAPNVVTDPTNPRKGDMWLRTDTNVLKVVDGTGATHTINWT